MKIKLVNKLFINLNQLTRHNSCRSFNMQNIIRNCKKNEGVEGWQI